MVMPIAVPFDASFRDAGEHAIVCADVKEEFFGEYAGDDQGPPCDELDFCWLCV